MPTGYTFKIEDGSMTELKDYAMACARAFGAYQGYRDCSEVPDKIEADQYYYDQLAKAQKQYDDFIKQSPNFTEAAKQYEEHIKERKNDYEKALDDYKEKKSRYLNMLEKVHSWSPGKEYEKLKDFMIQQLEVSIDGLYEPILYKDTKEEKQNYIEDIMTGKWEKQYLENAKESLDKAIQWANKANNWIDGLKESLK